jgi:5-methylthioadenosine/S-adenosylhomocysteine deaminase
MCESIENGVTTINDMYFMTEEIIKATKKCGIDCVSTVTLLDSDGKEGGERRKQNFINFVKTHPNEKITLGVHGLYTNSPKYLKECVELAKKLKINLLHMHFCENKSEVETIKKVYNVKHPSDVLKKYFKGFKLVLGHCVILDDQDFKTLNQLKASIVHNPVSNFRLGCGFADLVKMQKHKINITLGTDGQGSGSNLSILNSARLACLMPKAINNDPTVVTAYEALQMATINGAKALGLEKSKGSIEVGKDADLVIFNFKHTQLFPINDLISDIIYNANGEDTETVIIKGKTVYKNKKFANINIKGLIEKCKDIKNNILKK